ncbi:MAG TPA: hypothetical protein VK474_09135, partial [Chthoniobacterales bacterium]|nr:hypothetical protein [Chthoniobacterales bacterium]
TVVSARAAEPAASEAERLRALGKAVQQLQQRNAALEKTVRQLTSQSRPFAPAFRASDRIVPR